MCCIYLYMLCSERLKMFHSWHLISLHVYTYLILSKYVGSPEWFKLSHWFMRYQLCITTYVIICPAAWLFCQKSILIDVMTNFSQKWHMTNNIHWWDFFTSANVSNILCNDSDHSAVAWSFIREKLKIILKMIILWLKISLIYLVSLKLSRLAHAWNWKKAISVLLITLPHK